MRFKVRRAGLGAGPKTIPDQTGRGGDIGTQIASRQEDD